MQVYANSQASSKHYIEICQFRKEKKKDNPSMPNCKVTIYKTYISPKRKQIQQSKTFLKSQGKLQRFLTSFFNTRTT